MKIIPLISSDTAGPLGIKHLPRLWLKTLLSSTGQLPDGYKDIRPGFDFIVLEGLGIDPNAARDFILTNRPNYLSFEKWIQDQPNVDLSKANTSKVNNLIETKAKTQESRIEILKETGLPEDFPIESSAMLNNLYDWKAIHTQIVKGVEP